MLQHAYEQRGWVLVTDRGNLYIYTYIMTKKNIVDLDEVDAKAGETASCKNLPGGIGSRCIKMMPDVGMVTYPECL